MGKISDNSSTGSIVDTSSDGDSDTDSESRETDIGRGSHVKNAVDSRPAGTRRTPESGGIGVKAIGRFSGAAKPSTSSTKRRRSLSPSSTRLGSKETPINVDTVASLFEPVVIREYVRAFCPSTFYLLKSPYRSRKKRYLFLCKQML